MKIELHRLHISDSDDPEIIAGRLGNWAQTAKGQYCKKHFQDLTYVCCPNMNIWGFDIIVYGEIDPGPSVTEFLLHWNKP